MSVPQRGGVLPNLDPPGMRLLQLTTASSCSAKTAGAMAADARAKSSGSLPRPQRPHRAVHPHAAGRVPGPNHHSQRAAPALGAGGVRPLLQPPPAAPISRAARPRRPSRLSQARPDRPASDPRRPGQRLLPQGCLGCSPAPPVRPATVCVCPTAVPTAGEPLKGSDLLLWHSAVGSECEGISTPVWKQPCGTSFGTLRFLAV